MTDFDYIPIETTEGHRPPSPAGDRLLIGLAAVALAGGLLIAAGNLLGADDEVSIASESPAASPRPSRTPRPTPSPRPRLELAVEPRAVPSTPPETYLFSGWIRASTDLVVRAIPQTDAREVGILAEGAVAQVEETTEEPPGDLGWVRVNTPQPGGWVATLDGGTSLAQRYAQAPYAWGAGIWTLAAGNDGFLAIGTQAGRSDVSSKPIAMVSTDGARWRASGVPREWSRGWGHSIAMGPVGWLMAVVVDESSGPVVWISQSDDGRAWDSLGALETFPRDAWFSQIVASERGYLLNMGGGASSFLISVDGVTWRESDETGLRRDAYLRAVATSIGFYAWEDDGSGAATEEPAEAAFSRDGRTWSLVEGGPGGAARQVVSVGDRLLGMDADPVSGAPRLWVGILARGQVAWLRATEDEAPFRGAAPSTLISYGQRAVAFGWDRSTEDPLVWTLDATGWTRSVLPADDFKGIPRIAAAGPQGLVVVGYRPTLRGMNPIFWHETASGSWVPERSPILPVVPDPAGGECMQPPRDAVEFAVLDRVLAAACFGDEQISFRAWAAHCEGCYGSGDGSYEEAWLLGLDGDQLNLSPVEDDFGGWWTSAAVHPSLEYDRNWPGHWLEVTGHFDDPAALGCRWTPGPGEVWYYEGWRTLVDQCRQQFVVTAVSVVDGP